MHLPALSFRRLRRAVANACAAALVAAVALATTASLGAATAAGTPRCTTAKLVVWLDTMSNGYAGGRDYGLEFTNLSGHACTLFGYPGVSAVNLAGRQIGSAASRDNVHSPVVVTLAGGTTTNMAGTLATVVLKITDAGVYPPSACRQVTAAGLRVYPPGQTASKLVPFPFGACSRTGPVILHVEAIQKGA
jgi:hypothetical protein